MLGPSLFWGWVRMKKKNESIITELCTIGNIYYMTSTKNSQGFPIAMRNDCLLPDRSCWFCWCTADPVPVCTDCSDPLERLRLPFERFPFEPFPFPAVLFGIAGTDGMCNSDSDADEHDFTSCIGSLQIRSLPALLPPKNKHFIHYHLVCNCNFATLKLYLLNYE